MGKRARAATGATEGASRRPGRTLSKAAPEAQRSVVRKTTRPAWAIAGKTGTRQVHGSAPTPSPLLTRRTLLGGAALFAIGAGIGLITRRWEKQAGLGNNGSAIAEGPAKAPTLSPSAPMPAPETSLETQASTVTMADMPDPSSVTIDLPMAEGASPEVLGAPLRPSRMVLPDRSILAARPAAAPGAALPRVPSWLSSLGNAPPIPATIGEPPLPGHKPAEGHTVRLASIAPTPQRLTPVSLSQHVPTAATVPASPRGPVWLANALNVPDPGRRPMVSVVIDDLGLDRGRTRKVMGLTGPLTLSFMSYAEDLPAQTAAGHNAGHELMLHMPMQPQSAAVNPGPGALMVGQSADEIRRRLDTALGRFTGYVGLNNHMGSRFTANKPGMAVVMAEIHRRRLLFLDSRTIGGSVAPGLAQQEGVPFLERSIFLDHDPSRATVDRQLAQLEREAQKHGHAIAIGHPRDATIAGLAAWLRPAQARGLALVPASAILRFARPA